MQAAEDFEAVRRSADDLMGHFLAATDNLSERKHSLEQLIAELSRLTQVSHSVGPAGADSDEEQKRIGQLSNRFKAASAKLTAIMNSSGDFLDTLKDISADVSAAYATYRELQNAK